MTVSHQPIAPGAGLHTDADTRMRILSLLLCHRCMSASDIASTVELTGAAVRKHLAQLSADGLIDVADIRGAATGKRGRPATSWQITDAGRSLFGHSYDVLAVDALHALAEAGGRAAVAGFARRRARGIVAAVAPARGAGEADIVAAATDVAEAFSQRGYATTVHTAGRGIQICQHHCPIAAVAEQFPELCDAEAEIIAELVGHPVQPLATISAGNGVCTTNVPLSTVGRGTDPPVPRP